MAEPLKVEPDLAFIEEMSELGGESFKQCFQCATCSGTCPISPDKDPFPRKEMVWAVWGLKEKLIKDPDIWLCHQCNDCSIMCPRGGNPGDVLAAARHEAYQYYAVPGFLGKALASPKALPLLLLVPVLILGVALALVTGFQISPPAEGEPFKFADFFPTTTLLDPIFVLTAVVAIALFLTGLVRFWRDISEETKPIRGFVSSAMLAIGEILSHSRFNECDQAKPRYLGHMLTFYGFIALFITTTLVFIGYYLHHFQVGPGFAQISLPMPLYHPVKILGNVGAVLFFVGLVMLMYTRATDEEKAGRSNYQDWLFLVVLITIGVTGILTQLFRLGGVIGLACVIYFVHLVFVWFLIAYLPYSKFAHLAYRFLAITHAKQIGRYEMAADAEQPSSAAAADQPAPATEGEAAA